MRTVTKLAFVSALVMTSTAWAADVELIEQVGQQTQEEDLVFTIVTSIAITGEVWDIQEKEMLDQELALSPKAQWEQRFSEQYLGVLLDSRETESGFEWAGKLKVYFGKLEKDNRGKTMAWPQSETKDLSYQQTRASASRFVEVKDLPVGKNIRVYYAPTYTDWQPPSGQFPKGKFEERPSLVILHIDPVTGKKKTAIVAEGKLYFLRTDVGNPEDRWMTSIWYKVRAGAYYFGYLEAAGTERGIPLNLYTTDIVVYDNFEEPRVVYGQGGIADPDASGEETTALNVLFDKAQGKPVAAEKLQAAADQIEALMAE